MVNLQAWTVSPISFGCGELPAMWPKTGKRWKEQIVTNTVAPRE
jgi:hypothetical protein